MNLLAELGLKYGTDKGTKHHYLDVYYEMFKDRRNEVKKVLEIGPAEGAGLFMLRDFFPNATIYGAEIDQARVDKLQGLDRIKVFACDQSKLKDLKNIIDITGTGYLDLVIDDGSHRTSDQFLTAVFLRINLPAWSTIAIEDVHEPEELSKQLMKTFNDECDVQVYRCGSRYDDNLVIL